MDSTGEIEDIGLPGGPIAPTVGMSVAKSGRTTGFTTGTISSDKHQRERAVSSELWTGQEVYGDVHQSGGCQE